MPLLVVSEAGWLIVKYSDHCRIQILPLGLWPRWYFVVCQTNGFSLRLLL